MSALLTPEDALSMVFDLSSFRIVGKLRSKTCEDFPVATTTAQAGRFIQALDKNETTLKVFVYEHHAEIWRIRDWNESNTRHNERVAQEQKAIADYQRELALDTVRRRYADLKLQAAIVAFKTINIEYSGPATGLIDLLLANPTFGAFDLFGLGYVMDEIQSLTEECDKALIETAKRLEVEQARSVEDRFAFFSDSMARVDGTILVYLRDGRGVSATGLCTEPNGLDEYKSWPDLIILGPVSRSRQITPLQSALDYSNSHPRQEQTKETT